MRRWMTPWQSQPPCSRRPQYVRAKKRTAARWQKRPAGSVVSGLGSELMAWWELHWERQHLGRLSALGCLLPQVLTAVAWSVGKWGHAWADVLARVSSETRLAVTLLRSGIPMAAPWGPQSAGWWASVWEGVLALQWG